MVRPVLSVVLACAVASTTAHASIGPAGGGDEHAALRMRTSSDGLLRLAAKQKQKARLVLLHAAGKVPTSWFARLRAAAEGADPKAAWVQPPPVSLEETQLMLGCASWTLACAGQIASTVGADDAVVVDLATAGRGLRLGIDIVQADGSVTATGTRIDLSADDPDALGIAETFVRGAVAGAAPAVLVVRSDVVGAEVIVDGAPRGSTPLTLVDLAPGPHEVQLRHEGRAPVTRQVNLVAGALSRESVVLSSGGPDVASSPRLGASEIPSSPSVQRDDPAAMNVVGWTLTGLGALVAIGGGVAAGVAAVPVIRFWKDVDDNNQYVACRGRADNSDCIAFFEDYTANKGRYEGLLGTSIAVFGVGALILGSGVAIMMTSTPTEELSAAPSASTPTH